VREADGYDIDVEGTQDFDAGEDDRCEGQQASRAQFWIYIVARFIHGNPDECWIDTSVEVKIGLLQRGKKLSTEDMIFHHL
jgi:hypothetical protein